jgi:hypothetical protein
VKQLIKEKNQLKGQINSLVDLLQEVENKAESGGEELWMNLSDATVSVTLSHPPPADESHMLSSLMSTVGTVMNVSTEIMFEVQVDTPQTTASVSRSYAEFARLHQLLRNQFPKVGMISFPESSTENLSTALQSYLQLLISDEFIRQSTTLKEFVTLEGAFDADNTAAIGLMRKKMKDVFRSAASLVSSTQPLEQRRSRFYETKERHTAPALSSIIEGGGAAAGLAGEGAATAGSTSIRTIPNLYGVDDVISTGGTPSTIPESPAKRKDYSAVSTLITEEKDSLTRVPSVELPATPRRVPSTGSSRPAAVLDELSDAEIEMLVETFFAFIIETFDLREPNQWIRRKLLSVFKQLLKQAYGDTMNKLITESVNNFFGEASILRLLQAAHMAVWPNGEFVGRLPPPPPRSEEQKFATMVEARTIFLSYTPDILQNMAGRYNAVCGMTRIFHSLQHKELNKTLLFAAMDIILKLVFSEKPSPQ